MLSLEKQFKNRKTNLKSGCVKNIKEILESIPLWIMGIGIGTLLVLAYIVN